MNKIKVGDIVNTHGIKGELKIARTGQEEFNRDITYYIGKFDTAVKVERSRKHKNHYIIKLVDYNNINDVLKFKGQEIFINEDNLNSLDEDIFYIKDLIGIDVYLEDGKKLGILEDVLEYSANDVYIIKAEDKIISIPAVAEFIKDINIDDKAMTVKIIEGM